MLRSEIVSDPAVLAIISYSRKRLMEAAGVDHAALEKSAYRKASIRIIPLVALGYGAAYIDRVNISFASMRRLPRPTAIKSN